MKKVKEFSVQVIRHPSALHILTEFLGLEWPIKDIRVLRGLRINDLLGRGTPTFGDRLRLIEQLGYWAFCKRHGKSGGEIHYWLGTKIVDSKLIEVFAHELAHLVGYGDESSAVKIGSIAGFASELTKEVYGDRPK